MVRVVTDSGAHLSPELRSKYKIGTVPLQVLFGTRAYRDEVDLSNEQFFYMLTHEKTHPTTSAPAPQDFINVWKPILDAGEEIVSLSIPSGLSATFSSAVNAKAQLDQERGKETPITLIDGRWLSMAMGFQALVGARVALAGGSREAVAKAITGLDSRLSLVFLLDTLEYLKRGGRIGKSRAWLGTMFSVKPILEIAHASVEPLERVRSRKAGLARLLELVQTPPPTNGPREGDGPLHITVLHARAPEAAQQLENEIRARFNVAELVMAEIGPTIAVHTGPDALGLAFYRE
ncbi:MAG: DegV family protein [Anaerolineae bacterium]|nr:DegV family protein [Anaerolineae bacterium]